MIRKSVSALLVVLVLFSLMLTGCKKSATPPLEDLEDTTAMLQEAGANPTPAAQAVTEKATPVVVVEATPAPTQEPVVVETEAPTPAPTEAATPVVIATVEATVVATVEPAPATTTGRHVVQAGENLFRIALRYGTTVEALAKANGITNIALITVGQVLTIPGESGGPLPTPSVTPAPSGSGEKVHIVQPGENLFRIALKYNYSQYYLAKYNGIADPSLIYVGQVIRIP